MRATRSDDTILEGAFVPDRYIARVLPAGFAGADHFVLAIFAWALLGFANIYYGLARRVLEVSIEQVKSRKSPLLTRSMAWHPEVQQDVAQMVMEIESIGPDTARVRMHLTERNTRHGGTISGPAMFTLADFSCPSEVSRS